MNIKAAPYKIDFSRIDNPVEALLIPPLNFSAVTLPPGAEQAQGEIVAGEDRFSFISPNAEPENYRALFTRGERTTSFGFARRDNDSVRYRGNFEKSPVELTVGTEEARIRGKIGEVTVDETIKAPGFSRYLLAEGEIGGLDYEEKFYLGENGITASRGKLGEMDIEREFAQEKNGTIIKGRIGENRFEEYIVYRPLRGVHGSSLSLEDRSRRQ